MLQLIKIHLEKNLTPSRLHHSFEVAKESRRLAELYGADPERAYLAGLSHDICKNFLRAESLQLFEKFGIILDGVEKSTPKLWHAIAGEVYLRRIIGLEDEEILRAVRVHTTGAAGMSLLQKVLFVADFTSADRDYADVDEIRAQAEISLDNAAGYALCFTVKDLARRGKIIHPDTIHAYNECMFALKCSSPPHESGNNA